MSEDITETGTDHRDDDEGTYEGGEGSGGDESEDDQAQPSGNP